MDRALGAMHDEVVLERAVAAQGLGTDAGRPGVDPAPRRAGTMRAASATKERRLTAWRSSRAAARRWRAAMRQVPGQASVSARSRGRSVARR